MDGLGPDSASFLVLFVMKDKSISKETIQFSKSLIMCLRFELWVARWNDQANPLGYGPIVTKTCWGQFRLVARMQWGTCAYIIGKKIELFVSFCNRTSLAGVAAEIHSVVWTSLYPHWILKRQFIHGWYLDETDDYDIVNSNTTARYFSYF